MITETGYQSQTVEGLPAPTEFRSSSAADPVTIIPYRPSVLTTIKEVAEHRRFAFTVASTAVARHTKKYRLGATWIVFTTIMSVGGYSLIFGGGVFHVKTPHHMPYFLYLLVGMMGFNLFQSALNEANRSFLKLRKIVHTFRFPLILIPTFGTAYALFQFALNLTVYIVCTVYFWITRGVLYAQFSPKLLLMSAAGLGLCLMFAWAIGMWTGPLTYWARDVRMVISFVMPFYMLMTPVMYPVESLHGMTRKLAEINPLTSAIEMAKVGLLGVGAVSFWSAMWSVGFTFALFLSGYWFLHRYGPGLVTGASNPYDDGTDDDDDMDML